MLDAAAIRIVIQDEGGGQVDPSAPPKNTLGPSPAPVPASQGKDKAGDQPEPIAGEASRILRELLEPIVRRRAAEEARPGGDSSPGRKPTGDSKADDGSAAVDRAVRGAIRAAGDLPWIGPLVRAAESIANPVVRFGQATEALRQSLEAAAAKRASAAQAQEASQPGPQVRREIAPESGEPIAPRPKVEQPAAGPTAQQQPKVEPASTGTPESQAIRSPVPQPPAPPLPQPGAASKAFEKASEFDALRLKGMGQAIGENLRKALHDSVAATGELPRQEKGGFVWQAYEHLTQSGEQKGVATLDKAIAMAEAEIARRTPAKQPPAAQQLPATTQQQIRQPIEPPDATSLPQPIRQPVEPPATQPPAAERPQPTEPSEPQQQIRRPVPQPTETPVIRERISTRQTPDTVGLHARRARRAFGELAKHAVLSDWQSPDYRRTLRRKALRVAAGIRRTWKASKPMFGMASRAAASSGGSAPTVVTGAASAAVRAGGAAASAAGGTGGATASLVGAASAIVAASAPLLITVGAATAVFAGLVAAAKILDAKFRETADRLAPFSADISVARARAEVRQIQQNMESARMLGRPLAEYTDSSARISLAIQKMQDTIVAVLLDRFLPLVNGAADLADEAVKRQHEFKLILESIVLAVQKGPAGFPDLLKAIERYIRGKADQANANGQDALQLMFADLSVEWNGRRFGDDTPGREIAPGSLQFANPRPVPQLELP